MENFFKYLRGQKYDISKIEFSMNWCILDYKERNIAKN